MMDGHTPTIVNDSTKAIEIAGEVQPDLITLDLMMPNLSGFELCELLQQDPRFAHIPIIIISARDDGESKRRALQAGAKDYMIKPFDADEFILRISELIRDARA